MPTRRERAKAGTPSSLKEYGPDEVRVIIDGAWRIREGEVVVPRSHVEKLIKEVERLREILATVEGNVNERSRQDNSGDSGSAGGDRNPDGSGMADLRIENKLLDRMLECPIGSEDALLLGDASAVIRILREALEKIAARTCNERCANIARAALCTSKEGG